MHCSATLNSMQFIPKIQLSLGQYDKSRGSDQTDRESKSRPRLKVQTKDALGCYYTGWFVLHGRVGRETNG